MVNQIVRLTEVIERRTGRIVQKSITDFGRFDVRERQSFVKSVVFA